MITVSRIDAAAATVRARIEAAAGQRQPRPRSAGGDHDVTIVAVTKGFGIEAWEAALATGIGDVGESYAQEARAKLAAWDEAHPGQAPPRLHVIGRLQTNKVRALAGRVALWQSIDRDALLTEVARRDPGAAVLVQVNVGGPANQGGATPSDAARLVARARTAGLDVRGLMAIGAERDPEAARAGFARLRALADDLDLVECSMGMTDDLEVAVTEGATLVRIGTGLFGARPDTAPSHGASPSSDPPGDTTPMSSPLEASEAASPSAPPSMGQDARVRRQR